MSVIVTKKTTQDRGVCLCGSDLGSEHQPDCVYVKKVVRVRYTFDINVAVPSHWDAHDIHFYHNESLSCADNRIKDVQRYAEWLERNHLGCMCQRFKAEVLDMGDSTMFEGPEMPDGEMDAV